MRKLFETQVQDKALSADVDLIVSMPVIPALKHIMMIRTGNTSWGNLRAPLEPLNAGQRASIMANLTPENVA